MSDNVGLSTPRGSGTSGYVQRNLAAMRPRDMAAPYPPKDYDSMHHKQRQPDKDLLEHDRKREVEVKVFELRDKLEDEGVDEDEIDSRCDELRKNLLADMERASRTGGPAPRKTFKMHQVHEMADAKIRESERLRNALKISKDYQEGSHWRKQEERARSRLVGDGEGSGEASGPPSRPPVPSFPRDQARDGRDSRGGRDSRDSRDRHDTYRDRDYPGDRRDRGRDLSRSRSRSRSRDRDVKRVRDRSWSRSRSRSRSPSRSRSRSLSRSRSRSRSRDRDIGRDRKWERDDRA